MSYNLSNQILDLKKKQENQVQLLKQKQKSDEAAKRLQDEIHFIKAQKVERCIIMTPRCLNYCFFIVVVSLPFLIMVLFYMSQVQLQQKIKQEAEQFRQWKASREKELLQVYNL